MSIMCIPEIFMKTKKSALLITLVILSLNSNADDYNGEICIQNKSSTTYNITADEYCLDWGDGCKPTHPDPVIIDVEVRPSEVRCRGATVGSPEMKVFVFSIRYFYINATSESLSTPTRTKIITSSHGGMANASLDEERHTNKEGSLSRKHACLDPLDPKYKTCALFIIKK